MSSEKLLAIDADSILAKLRRSESFTAFIAHATEYLHAIDPTRKPEFMVFMLSAHLATQAEQFDETRHVLLRGAWHTLEMLHDAQPSWVETTTAAFIEEKRAEIATMLAAYN